MSVDTFIFLNNDRLPSRDAWQHALDNAETGMTLDVVDNLREFSGYLPVKFNGADSGFEWYYGPVEEVFGRRPRELADRDFAIDFVTHSDMQELTCALYAAGVLGKLADGLFHDEERDAFVPCDRVLEIVRNIGVEERDRKRRLAEKDANLTDRRCPECGAPCPTYRKTCIACGYAIGRA
ncbi:MAG: hypothetical protein HQ518_21830 [Rhodopirellula sp.]|nr:hypothetical protein [Rhodopirellula sp.]